MKSLKVLLLAGLAFLSVCDRCRAAETRMVGNVEVDIQPLVDWTAKQKGDRPLKHWKLVRVLEQKRQSALPVLLCDIEGLKTEIILKNCPKELLDLLHQKSALEAKLAAARRDQESAAGSLGGARNKREANQAKRTHTATKEVEKTVKKALADLDQKIKQQQKVFAMSTGTTFDGQPVWDTGLRSR